MATITNERLHGLDAVRGGALLMGVFFHAGLSFLPGDQIWLVADASRSEVISGISYVLHMFRMPLFFLLAGYFGRMALHRRGTVRFVGDRLLRIGVPMVLFWPAIITAIGSIMAWLWLRSNAGAGMEELPPAPPMTAETFPLTHLWFLYVLLIFYAVALVLRLLGTVLFVGKPLGRLIDGVIAGLGRVPVLPIVLALPVAWAFVTNPAWHPFFGVPTPDYGFVPNRTALIAYGAAFAMGWLLQRQPEHLSRIIRPWPVYLLAAIGLTAFTMQTLGLTIAWVMPLEDRLWPYAFGYAVALWAWVFGLLGLSMAVFSGENAVRRYIADASYWIYLIHLPLVIALQVLVSDWPWPALVKYGFVLAVSLPLLFLSYHLLVRYSFMGRLLNGKKRTRASRREGEAA